MLGVAEFGHDVRVLEVFGLGTLFGRYVGLKCCRGGHAHRGHVRDKDVRAGDLLQDGLRDVRGSSDILGIVIDLGTLRLLIVGIDGDELAGVLQRIAHKVVMQLRIAITLP
ncbi:MULTISPECIES: hypothetical protein [Bradyrhizobium]|uniref:hypothetical protein n=1 Tax=Bradyrhizobium TaxID=374 RepID=UPI0004570045|nr:MULTISPECIES: hypothetical protein [Bradyrhizobium]MCP1759606.1 hypothetical protein [Bradyrhizobium japonicum]MCP1791196.1 hypothetical protein [Bradyrhizobium japonicum]MCP1803615.1 hypothetical protein [Bradyrhizobium japonicum]MCP1812639.1 hypothetical protein [Bradyrhizobium japonicum]MCP1875939.1 hypothetical protein [Bradyrhizobium japonicum]